MTSQSDKGDWVGQAPAAAGSGDFNAMQFMIRQVLGKLGTTMLVEVMAVTNAGGVSPVGFVDIKPMVAQTDGAGNVTAHGTIFNVPYFRLQGGANAVILDPEVGDIGIASVASRDISSAKATKAAAAPGSRRRFDLADSLYIGGVLNGAPTQYVRFSAAGVEIKSPTKIILDAPAVEVVGGTLTHNGVNVGDDHTHDGVEPGGGNTGPPS